MYMHADLDHLCKLQHYLFITILYAWTSEAAKEPVFGQVPLSTEQVEELKPRLEVQICHPPHKQYLKSGSVPRIHTTMQRAMEAALH